MTRLSETLQSALAKEGQVGCPTTLAKGKISALAENQWTDTGEEFVDPN